MNYKRIYDDLVTTRLNQEKSIDTYYERHHIIPKSLGGSNSKDNIVYFTAREHYIAHLLLYKIAINKNEKTKMAYALHAMKWNQIEQRDLTSRQYENIKKIYAKDRSENMKGKDNHFYGKTHSDKTRLVLSEKNKHTFIEKFGETDAAVLKQRISKSLKGRVPWNKGKNIKFSDTALENIKIRRYERLSQYLITRPDGSSIIIKDIAEFCSLETAKSGVKLTKSGFKNLLNNKNRKENSYRGYIIERK